MKESAICFLQRSLVLIGILAKYGSTWTLENPGTSLLFHVPAVKRLTFKKDVSAVCLDQCMFGLRIPGSDLLVKKYTKIIGNVDLTPLAVLCDKGQEHIAAIGGIKTPQGWRRRTSLAGAYPQALCAALERAVRAHYC